MRRLSVVQRLLHPYKGHGFFIYIGRLLSKTIMFFCFNNKLNKRNKSDCWNLWTLAFTEWNKFGKGVQHVDVDRFVSFAERLRSLSCFVYLLYWFHLLFNNIALKCKICLQRYIFFHNQMGWGDKKALSIEVEKQDFSCSICKTMKKLYLCKSRAKTWTLFTRNNCRASWTLFLILPLFHVHHFGVVKSSWGWLDLTAGWNGM